MAHEFTARRVVEFHETDMAGIVHFANVFRWMEATEHAFFRALGTKVHSSEGGRMQGWARVHAECDYRAPIFYQDVVEVRLAVRDKRPSALTYDFVFTRVEPDGPTEVARGSLTAVCVAREQGEARMKAVPMPPEVARLIEVAPPDLLERPAS